MWYALARTLGPVLSLAIALAFVVALVAVTTDVGAAIDGYRQMLADVLIALDVPVMTDGQGRFMEVLR